MSINKVVISGNLTRDAELRETQSGFQVLGFSVAVSDRRKNQLTGEWEDWTNFVDCAMFGNRAASVAGFLLKGTKVAIEGRLHYSSWEKDGQKRSKLDVTVDEIEFMATREDGDGGRTYGSARPPQKPAQADLYDEDIPF